MVSDLSRLLAREQELLKANNKIHILQDALTAQQKKIDDYENGSELPCGHIGVFLTLGDEGFHCSKCDRIYTDWAGMPDKLTAYHKLVEKVKALLKGHYPAYIVQWQEALREIEGFEKEQGK